MNRFLVLISFLLLASATQLRADGLTDPNIRIRDPFCDSVTPCAPLVGGPTGTAPFTFTSDGASGGISTFQVPSNTFGGFFSLDIETPGAFSVVPPTNCDSNVFVCTVTNFPGVTDMFFSTADGFPGIPSGDYFTINLNDPIGGLIDGGSWGEFHPFTAFPNLPTAPTSPLISTPEPGTLVLFTVGMAGLFACRKFTHLLGLRA